MAQTEIRLNFEGYWLETKASSLPKRAGVYVVYECAFNPKTYKVTLQKVIFIGQAEDIHAAIASLDKAEWKKHCASNNQLCFSFAPLEGADREQAEAALIYKHQPPANGKFKDSFPFNDTRLSLSGKAGLLTALFTVSKA